MTSEQRPARRSGTKASATAARLDLVVAGAIAVLGVSVWIESGTWGEARNLAQDPTVLPRGIAIVLWGVAVSMAVRFARGWRGKSSHQTAAERAMQQARGDRAASVAATSTPPEPWDARAAGDGSPGDASTEGGTPDDGSAEAGEVPRGDAAAAEEEDPSLVGALVALAAASVYAWTSFRLGWMVTTWLFITVTVVVLGRERWSLPRLALIAVIGLVSTGAIWFGFVELLNVRIPATPLP